MEGSMVIYSPQVVGWILAGGAKTVFRGTVAMPYPRRTIGNCDFQEGRNGDLPPTWGLHRFGFQKNNGFWNSSRIPFVAHRD